MSEVVEGDRRKDGEGWVAMIMTVIMAMAVEWINSVFGQVGDVVR